MTKTVHLAYRGDRKSLCGRDVDPMRPIHRDWPACRSCERVRIARDEPAPTRVWNGDGWLVRPMNTNTEMSVKVITVTVFPWDDERPAA